jgi:hypothetical protein
VTALGMIENDNKNGESTIAKKIIPYHFFLMNKNDRVSMRLVITLLSYPFNSVRGVTSAKIGTCTYSSVVKINYCC